MSNISALQSALSGLLAQRHRLDTIGHNIANVGTEGYSRQRVDLASGGNGPIPALFSDGLVSGDGVDVAGISRFRDEFLEVRSLDERSASSQLALQSRYFERIELVHTEPSDDGLDSIVMVNGDLVAVLHGAPTATASDVYAEVRADVFG